MQRLEQFRQRPVGYLMMGAATTLFGLNGTLATLLFRDGISPLTLVEFRMLIGGLCLLIFLLLAQRQGLKLPRRQWGWMLVLGLALALVTYTYFVAISRLPIAIALVIQFSAPAWIVLGESIWRRRLPSKFIVAALLLTFGGISLLTGVWQESFSGLDTLGLIFAALSIVTFIAYLLVGSRVGRDLPSLTSTTYGAFIAALFWFFVQPPWTVPAGTWTPVHLLLIFLVGLVGMALPFSLELASLRRLGPARASIASMFELVTGGIIAYFWLGQILTFWQISGGVLVLAGIVILQLEKTGTPPITEPV